MPAVAVFEPGFRAAGDCRIGKPRQIDFRQLLGRVAWFQLPEAVRRRFDLAAHEETRFYPGTMSVKASWAGRLIATLLRLVGTPLPPQVGEDVGVIVEVRGDGRGGIVWDRTYRFAGCDLRIASTKRVDAAGRLMEVVKGGLGMRLACTVEDRVLHFRSTGYFVELGPWTIDVPRLLTPGEAHVIHEDKTIDGGDGRFRFALSFDHPILGRTFEQDGLFHDPRDLRLPEFRNAG